MDLPSNGAEGDLTPGKQSSADTWYRRKTMTLSEAFEAYRLDCIVFRNQSKKTEENHLVCLRSITSFLGDKPVAELSFEDVRSWKEYLSKKRSSTTVRNYIIKLRVVLAYLRVNGVPTLNPDTVPVPKRADRVPDFISKEQVSLLIEANDKVKNNIRKIRNKALISLLFASGIRVSELCSLNIGDVKDRRFTIVGKGGKARLCFIDERTELLLCIYLDMRTNGYVIYNYNGTKRSTVRATYKPDNNPALFLEHQTKSRITPGNVQELFKNCRRNAGFTIKISPHTLRHSYATQKMAAGMHIYTLSRLMGHASIATTQTYLHIADPLLQQEYNRYHQV